MLVTKQENEKFFLIELDAGGVLVVNELAKIFAVDTEFVIEGMFKFAECMAISKIINPISKEE